MTRRRPMRVLITADAVGGVWQYAVELADALVPLGFAPTIALLGPTPSPAQRAELRSSDVDFVETGLPLDWLSDGPEPVLAAGRAIAALARDFDLVQLNMPTLGAAHAFDLPTVAVAHGCLATWWMAAGEGALPIDMHWQRRLTGAGLRAASAIVAPTRAYAAVVRRQYRLAETPLAIHNGRRPLASVAAATTGRTRIFTAGRLWDLAKDARLLDRVAARLPVPFVAAGAVRGPHGETISPDRLRLLGVIDQAALAARLAERPIFVSAARFEPFGLAVLEAAAAGCPLVLSDIPTFRELWDGAASFVPSGDEAGFADTILQLLADPTARATMGAAAARRAARYTPEATAAALAALYERLARQGQRAAA